MRYFLVAVYVANNKNWMVYDLFFFFYECVSSSNPILLAFWISERRDFCTTWSIQVSSCCFFSLIFPCPSSISARYKKMRSLLLLHWDRKKQPHRQYFPLGNDKNCPFFVILYRVVVTFYQNKRIELRNWFLKRIANRKLVFSFPRISCFQKKKKDLIFVFFKNYADHLVFFFLIISRFLSCQEKQTQNARSWF